MLRPDDDDRGLVLSLCDFSGVMVDPWLDAGYRCMIVDLQHREGVRTKGNLTKVGADILTWLPPLDYYAAVFAFPPCTHLAKGGARHFRDKGLPALIEGLTIVERCRAICEWSGAPWMLENPVGTLSTYWRSPDLIFDPWEYAAYLDHDGDAYTKKTCIWTGQGFVMPERLPKEPMFGDRTSSFGQSKERANLRSLTPEGFARAVFESNHVEG